MSYITKLTKLVEVLGNGDSLTGTVLVHQYSNDIVEFELVEETIRLTVYSDTFEFDVPATFSLRSEIKKLDLAKEKLLDQAKLDYFDRPRFSY